MHTDAAAMQATRAGVSRVLARFGGIATSRPYVAKRAALFFCYPTEKGAWQYGGKVRSCGYSEACCKHSVRSSFTKANGAYGGGPFPFPENQEKVRGPSAF